MVAPVRAYSRDRHAPDMVDGRSSSLASSLQTFSRGEFEREPLVFLIGHIRDKLLNDCGNRASRLLRTEERLKAKG